MEKFKDLLKDFRLQQGLTQKEFAEKLEIEERSYQHYESGSRNPSIATFLKLVEKFDVSADYFLGRTQNKQSHKSDQLKYIKETLKTHDEIRQKLNDIDVMLSKF